MRLRDILEGKTEDAQYYVELNIENVQELYKLAMAAKDAKELKNSMIDNFPVKFPDAGKIQFDQIDWKAVFTKIHED